MRALIVLENPQTWSLAVPGAEVVSAKDYLLNPDYSYGRRVKVFNLCRTYGYQTLGYYVSLLAVARGHRPLPSVATIQDLRQAPMIRIASLELEEEIQRVLNPLKSDKFTLSIYFGRNVARRYDRLARALFNQFPAPLLRADFHRKDDWWRLEALKPIAADDIPESHRAFLVEQAERNFERAAPSRSAQRYRYDLAILVNPDEENPPSDERALAKFVRAAHKVGLDASFIEREDYGRIAEYDALFIRETTAVNHHTYRFSRRAAAEGLVVIDDPESIIRCTNKVYLSEMFERRDISAPKTIIVHRENLPEVVMNMPLPCVVKRPDSSFSTGVAKAKTAQELRSLLLDALQDSQLAIVQEFVSSAFDWRVGVLADRPLWVCRYYMAKGDWRIQTKDQKGKRHFGKVETIPVEDAPANVLKLALRATRPIGEGLYGVDIKETEKKLYVMEVNDNPSIESDVEDKVMKDELYLTIMEAFRARLDIKRGRSFSS